MLATLGKGRICSNHVEDSYSTKRTVDGKEYRLDIIDTAGQEEYRDMLGSLFTADHAIDAYLLVYDITSPVSLENLECFDEMIEKTREVRDQDAPAPVKLVAGNKCDLSEMRVIPAAEGLAWAKEHGCGFMETSAKAMVNIEETFEIIIRQVAQNRAAHQQKKASQPGTSSTGARPTLRSALSSNNMRASASNEKSKQRSTCCTIS